MSRDRAKVVTPPEPIGRVSFDPQQARERAAESLFSDEFIDDIARLRGQVLPAEQGMR